MTPSEKFYDRVTTIVNTEKRDWDDACEQATLRYRSEYEAMKAAGMPRQQREFELANSQRLQRQLANSASVPGTESAVGSDPLFSVTPPFIKTMLGLSPHASEKEWRTALKAAGNKLTSADASKIFSDLVKLLQVHSQLSYDDAWTRAQRDYPAVYQAMSRQK